MLCLGHLRNRRRTCRSVLSGRCRSAARLDGPSLLDCSNMARTIADDDGQKHPMFAQISRMVDWPVVGDLLYRLNVNRFMVRKMALGHVYAELSSLSEARFEEKLAVTRASGARHSSIRFVAGELDPMATWQAFLSAAQQVNDLIIVV